jgi:hypothetical protein
MQLYFYINVNYDFKPNNESIHFIIRYINILYNFNK